MNPSSHVELSTQDLEELAWEFLGSEFTTEVHIDWPIDRCVHAYLLHHRLIDVANDGAASSALLDRVMANIAPAIRSGILTSPHVDRSS